MVTHPRTDRPLQDVGILVLVQVEMGQHEPSRFDRVFHNREHPSGVRPGDLEHTPMPPSQTDRPLPGSTTIVGTSIFGPFVSPSRFGASPWVEFDCTAAGG